MPGTVRPNIFDIIQEDVLPLPNVPKENLRDIDFDITPFLQPPPRIRSRNIVPADPQNRGFMPQPTLRQLLDPEGQGVLQTAFRENQANKELVRQGSVMGNPREGFDLGSLLPAGQISQTSDRALVNLLKRFPRLYNAAEAVPQEIRLLIGGLKNSPMGQRLGLDARDIQSMFQRPSRMGASGQLDMPAIVGSIAERDRLRRELPRDIILNPTIVGEGAERVNPMARPGEAFGSLTHETGHGLLGARGVSEGQKAGLAKRLKDLLPDFVKPGLDNKAAYPTVADVNEEIITRSLEAVALARQYPQYYKAERLSELMQEVNRSVLPILEGRTPMLGR